MDFLKLFEEKIANYTKFKYAVTVDCCTNGIKYNFHKTLYKSI